MQNREDLLYSPLSAEKPIELIETAFITSYQPVTSLSHSIIRRTFSNRHSNNPGTNNCGVLSPFPSAVWKFFFCFCIIRTSFSSSLWPSSYNGTDIFYTIHDPEASPQQVLCIFPPLSCSKHYEDDISLIDIPFYLTCFIPTLYIPADTVFSLILGPISIALRGEFSFDKNFNPLNTYLRSFYEPCELV